MRKEDRERLKLTLENINKAARIPPTTKEEWDETVRRYGRPVDHSQSRQINPETDQKYVD